MPIYEYECPRCGRFDVLQKISSPTLEVHDVCGSKVRKLMSAGAFVLKGSGFYANDYGGKNCAAAAPRTSDNKAKPNTGGCAAGPCGSSACKAAHA